ncbi:STAS/SEC14 domain-containing protein [Desulfovibrio inopinatus]|uniref:STAS/SEC14 domain-containing protein n=1 Tax=Desulfovibrio inopinatus TaxID=102109 RepID=UPI000418FCD3|nr:STAS/SEC14 domain-containing protein [Desulfovibrio inopinatus]
MFTILDGTENNILGVEITGGYMKEDFNAVKKAFEDILAQGHDRVNVLCKIDKMKFLEGELSAFIADGRYALSHRDKLRHVAIVANSSVVETLISLDNAIFGDPQNDLIEKYFDIKDIDDAWEFVRH